MVWETCRLAHSELIQHQERIQVSQLEIKYAQYHKVLTVELCQNRWGTHLLSTDAPADTSTDSLRLLHAQYRPLHSPHIHRAGRSFTGPHKNRKNILMFLNQGQNDSDKWVSVFFFMQTLLWDWIFSKKKQNNFLRCCNCQSKMRGKVTSGLWFEPERNSFRCEYWFSSDKHTVLQWSPQMWFSNTKKWQWHVTEAGYITV